MESEYAKGERGGFIMALTLMAYKDYAITDELAKRVIGNYCQSLQFDEVGRMAIMAQMLVAFDVAMVALTLKVEEMERRG